jgi:hypothetical protein
MKDKIIPLEISLDHQNNAPFNEVYLKTIASKVLHE